MRFCDVCRKRLPEQQGRGRPAKRHPDCRKIDKVCRNQLYRHRAEDLGSRLVALERRERVLLRLIAKTRERIAVERAQRAAQDVRGVFR